MRKVSLIISIFVLSLYSCKKGPEKLEREYITSTLESVTFPNTVKWVVLLPGLGCHGCIKEGEAFMKDHIDNKEIVFILTKIESLKILQHKIGIQLTDYPNVIVDNNDEINVPSNNSVYPCVIHMDDGDIKLHEFQSPGNNAFEKLRSYIAVPDKS